MRIKAHTKVGDLVRLDDKPGLGSGVVIEQNPPADVCAGDPRYNPIFKVQWPYHGRCWYSAAELEVVSESR
jgi:hypothetical protein